MANLEVHDDRGRVEYVTIPRDTTALIGSDPKCDVVVAHPSVRPIHARLRFKKGKYRIEATPEARTIVVNGTRMVKSSLKQGDEINLGGYRIFLLYTGDAAPDTEKTRIQSRPAAIGALEARDWLRELEVAPPSLEEPRPEPSPQDVARPLPQRGSRASATTGAAHREAAALSRPPGREAVVDPNSEPRPQTSWFQRTSRVLVGQEQVPGEERIWSSPLVLSLIGMLVVLAVFSFGLWGIIVRQTADNAFRRATDALIDADYRNAIVSFDRFLELAPDDPRVSEARVRRSLATIQRYLAGGEQAWAEALGAARAMAGEMAEEPAFEDVRAEMANVVVTILSGLTDRTRRTADEQDLRRIEEALQLHDRLAGAGAAAARDRFRLPEKIAAARASVRKAQTRSAALAAMDAALGARSASGIYRAYDDLVAEYPDMAQDRAVNDRMNQASALLRDAVIWDPTPRSAETSPRPEPLGPPTSLVIRSGPTEGWSEPGGASPPMVFALVDGNAYGLNALTGEPLWQRPLGVNSPFAPIAVGGPQPSVIAFDSRHHELVRLDAATGDLIWRQDVGEPLRSRPLIAGNTLYQVTPSGNVHDVDLSTGSVRGVFRLKAPLVITPVADELGRYLYVFADRSVLYILTREPAGCAGVVYLGYESGALRTSPVRVGSYLIVPENPSLDRGRWRVFALEDEGRSPGPIQRVDVNGWTWDPPASQGSVIWALGDLGGLTAYAVGGGRDRTTLRPIAGVPPDAEPSGPAYTRARTEREVWISSDRIARYDLNPERGELSTGWTIVDVGPALGPIQFAGGLAVFTHRTRTGRGTELLGVNSSEGRVVWRTILGHPWSVSPFADADGNGVRTIGMDGMPLTIPSETLRRGGFVSLPRPVPGAFQMPARQLGSLNHRDWIIVIPEDGGRELLVSEGTSALQPIALPSPPAAIPRFWGEDLLVPGMDGLVYLIDPRTGSTRADPFVPAYDRDRPIRWRTPVIVGPNSAALVDRSGRVLTLGLEEEPRRRLVSAGMETDLGVEITSGPAASLDALVLTTADQRLRTLSALDLSPLGAWPFSGRPAVGPDAVGEGVAIADAWGRLAWIGSNGQRSWDVELPGGAPVGMPIRFGDEIVLLDRSGHLERRSPLEGSLLDRIELHIVPEGGPIGVGESLAIPVSPGTLALMSMLPSVSSSAPTEERTVDSGR